MAEQLLVWCAAIPAILILGRRWMVPLGIVGTALVFSFTRSVWLGAVAGLLVSALVIPRKVLIGALSTDRDHRRGRLRPYLPSSCDEL